MELDRQRQIRVTTSTRFEGGSRADLKSGRLVEVEVGQGNQATEIEFDTDFDTNNVALSKQFRLSGLANWDNGILTINNVVFTLDALTRFDDGLNTATLDGRWVELEGLMQSGLNLVREIEPDRQDSSLDLTGQINTDSLWGYRTSDGSLARWNGLWVEVECHFDGNRLSNCHQDD